MCKYLETSLRIPPPLCSSDPSCVCIIYGTCLPASTTRFHCLPWASPSSVCGLLITHLSLELHLWSRSVAQRSWHRIVPIRHFGKKQHFLTLCNNYWKRCALCFVTHFFLRPAHRSHAALFISVWR